MPNDAIPTSPPWVTARQVADRYSVTVPTVFNWLRAGIIPARIAVGRIYRFDPVEVDAALERRSERSGRVGCSLGSALANPTPERGDR